MKRVFLGLSFLIASVYAAGCNASLPEPESEGALLYTQRCSGCHRVYHPRLSCLRNSEPYSGGFELLGDGMWGPNTLPLHGYL